MKCARLDQLSAYLEGELSPEETAGIRSHLAACPHCRREVAALDAMVQGLREMSASGFGVEEQDQVLAALMARIPSERRRPRLRLFEAAAVVLLAFGLGFLGSGLYQVVAPGPEPATTALQVFVSEHRGYETLLAVDSDLSVQVAMGQ